MKTDKRAQLQLKIWINKHLGNKDAINTELARIITEFSHGTLVKPSTLFWNSYPNLFWCIKEVLSPFWCTVYQMHSRIGYGGYYTSQEFNRLYYEPNWDSPFGPFRKRIHDPFSNNPYLKDRSYKYYLRKISHYNANAIGLLNQQI